MASPKHYVLGIDGGGTKTLGIIADLQGNVVASASGGMSNVQIAGADGTARVCFDVLERCCRRTRCKPDQLQAVVLGLAGAGREPDRLRTERAIRALARERGVHLRNLRVESDGRIAVEGALGGNAGIVIVAGTGSVGFAKDADGNIHRVGGWGRVIGDEGSGFAIGREALRAISKHLDGRGEPTLLTALAGKILNLSDPVTIISKVYQDHFDVSSVAPLVLRAAEKGDRVARKILDKGSSELVDHVKVLLKKLRSSKKHRRGKKISVALLGGLLEYPNYFSRTLKKKIKSKFLPIKIQTPQRSPAYGAVLLALERARNYSRASLSHS